MYERQKGQPCPLERFVEIGRAVAQLRLQLARDAAGGDSSRPMQRGVASAAPATARQAPACALLRLFDVLPRDAGARAAAVRATLERADADALLAPALRAMRRALLVRGGDDGLLAVADDADPADAEPTSKETKHAVVESGNASRPTTSDLLPGLLVLVDILQRTDGVSAKSLQAAADTVTSWAAAWTSPERSLQVG